MDDSTPTPRRKESEKIFPLFGICTNFTLAYSRAVKSVCIVGDALIYIIWGHPGQGKSYFGTAMAVRGLEEGRKVFTNYPVVYRGKSTYIWQPEFAGLPSPPTGATIVIDEAYRNYNSRKFSGFSVQEHTYFATNRHNNLEIYLIAQNPARIDVTIREISQFILMKKVQVPLLKFIIGFKAEFYEMIEDLSARKMGQESHYSVEWIWFSKKVANAYDTHFYGVKTNEEFIGTPWVEISPETSSRTSKKIKLPTMLTKVRTSIIEIWNRGPHWKSLFPLIENRIEELKWQKYFKSLPKIKLITISHPEINYSKMPFWKGFFLFFKTEFWN